MAEHEALEGLKIIGDFFETQNKIGRRVAKNRSKINKLCRTSLVLTIAVTAVSVIVYDQNSKIEKLICEVKELRREKGE